MGNYGAAAAPSHLLAPDPARDAVCGIGPLGSAIINGVITDLDNLSNSINGLAPPAFQGLQDVRGFEGAFDLASIALPVGGEALPLLGAAARVGADTLLAYQAPDTAAAFIHAFGPLRPRPNVGVGIADIIGLKAMAPTASGNVSASAFAADGVALEIADRGDIALAEKIIANGDRSRAVTEELVESFARREGLIILGGGKHGRNNGFDHVFQDARGNVYILDSKQLRNGSASLGSSKRGNVQQLSDLAVRATLDELDQISPVVRVMWRVIDIPKLYRGVIGLDRTTGYLNPVRVK